LASTGDIAYKELMNESIKEQSYKVIAAGILGLTKFAPEEGNKALASLDEDTKKHVTPLMKKLEN
jgi:aminopeptidase N